MRMRIPGGSPPKILVVGAFRFPNGDAPGLRVLGIVRALRASGYEVDVIGLPSTAEAQSDGGGPQYYDGVPSWTFEDAGIPARQGKSAVGRYLRSGGQTLAWLEARPWLGVRGVIAYGGTALFLLRLDRLCRARKVPLILDCVEWFDGKHGLGGRLGAVHGENTLKMTVVVPRVRKIIGISTYLAGYYDSRGCRVIVVPPLIDAENVEWSEVAGEPLAGKEGIQLAFAGAPHRERWDLIFEGLELLETWGGKASIRLFGGLEEDLISALGKNAIHWPRWRRHVRFEGKLRRRDFLEAMAGCDAGFLLREDARWSRACFPSKVPEMLRLGLPIVFNRTSDLGDYLEDGREGLVVAELSAESFARTVLRLASLTALERASLRQRAAWCASEAFDYRAYSEALNGFIRECNGEAWFPGG